MKTRVPDPAAKNPLPPPPAPTARDANPWPMSTAPRATRQRVRHPRGPHQPPGAADSARPVGRRSSRIAPLAILLFMAGIGVRVALEALGNGRIEAAIGALLVVVLVVALLMRQLFRKRE